MEISHRGKLFMRTGRPSPNATCARLMNIPQDYKVLFLQGGATQHFAQIPMNFARPRPGGRLRRDRALGREGGARGGVARRGSTSPRAAPAAITRHCRARANWSCIADAAYVHYTPNETIQGVEFPDIPDVGDVPLVADMSSIILSQPIDVSKFGVIYAGAQKNIGAAGPGRHDRARRSARALSEDAAEDLQLCRARRAGFDVEHAEHVWLVSGRSRVQVAARRRRARRDRRAQPRQGRPALRLYRWFRLLPQSGRAVPRARA